MNRRIALNRRWVFVSNNKSETQIADCAGLG